MVGCSDSFSLLINCSAGPRSAATAQLRGPPARALRRRPGRCPRASSPPSACPPLRLAFGKANREADTQTPSRAKRGINYSSTRLLVYSSTFFSVSSVYLPGRPWLGCSEMRTWTPSPWGTKGGKKRPGKKLRFRVVRRRSAQNTNSKQNNGRRQGQRTPSVVPRMPDLWDRWEKIGKVAE